MMFLTPYTKKHNEMSNYNPWRAMEELERNFFGNNTMGSFETDIRDAGDAFILEADLPGFKKEDIHIDLADGNLTIHAQRNNASEDKDENGYIRRERSYGEFSRSFNTEGIDVKALKASFDNGVLTLHMPKLTKAENQIQRIEIE